MLKVLVNGLNFRHCTIIGKKDGRRPIIGNNVELGANVIIIGAIIVGDNVSIGAGSVVVKDIPKNSIVAGNPAKIIKMKIIFPPRKHLCNQVIVFGKGKLALQINLCHVSELSNYERRVA